MHVYDEWKNLTMIHTDFSHTDLVNSNLVVKLVVGEVKMQTVTGNDYLTTRARYT